ncbi:MAG: glycosyltransferase, partial [Phototrophicaceae bacterium]
PINAAYADEIDRLIAARRLTSHVTWTGYVDDVAVSAYLTASDAVVLPFRDGASYRRGSLMAAVQHGCAIITTQPTTRIPLFKDGENMLLARPHVLDENCPPFFHISHKILQLYRDPALRERLRAGAVALADEFNWATIAADTVAFFEAVIADRKRQSS